MNVDIGMLFNMPPERAVEYMQAKGYAITWDWHEMLENAHDTAFTVAKVTKAEVLQTIRHEVDRIFVEGITEKEFISQLTPRLQSIGWWGRSSYTAADGTDISYQMGSTHRLQTIYQTNNSVAYAAGRWSEFIDNAEFQQNLMYSAVLDASTRERHRLLDGTVKPINDMFWSYFAPPNGWRCRCTLIALSNDDLDFYGYKASHTQKHQYSTDTVEAGIDKRTGEIRHAQVTTFTDSDGQKYRPDLGWNHNPALQQYRPDLSRYDPDLRSQL